MMTIEERRNNFINKAKIIHKNENIDYSHVVYINNRTPVTLIDHDLKPNGEEYGVFLQSPSNHLKGGSHPLKRANKISSSKALTNNEIIERFKRIHKGENLDYSKVNYINMHTKVKIIDHDINEDTGKEYGEYWQEPIVHLKGCGHPLKGNRKRILSQYSNTTEFINKAKKIHLDKDYDYSYVNYVNNRTKVEIVCNKKCRNGKDIHGSFFITPDNFLQGKGCPKCGNHLSYAEDELIEFLSKHFKVEKNNRKILNGKEIDIYIYEKRFGIEYNGLKWHTEKYGKKDKYYHLDKTIECNKREINLVHIFEDEYLFKKNIVLNKLKDMLEIDKETLIIVGYNEYVIKEVDKDTENEFLEKYHIEGYDKDTDVCIGAFYYGELIFVMSLINRGNNNWEIIKLCNKHGFNCERVEIGLFDYFIKKYNVNEVICNVDRRWIMNEISNTYTRLGFSKEGEIEPQCKYYNGNGCRLDEDEGNCDKIWDCGKIIYKWKKEN